MRMEELRFGVVGWGYWGPKMARNLDALAQATVTMVADLEDYRLASLKISHPWIKTTTRAQDVFGSDLDGVVIATPVRTHYRLAKEALVSGKHVLVEKPLTTSIAQAQELVTLAQEQGRILMVGHTFEYNPAVNEFAETDVAEFVQLLRRHEFVGCVSHQRASGFNIANYSEL